MASNLFLGGLIAHLIADWFLQSNWMAMGKTSLRHPAAWVHSGIHLVALLFVFSPFVALLLAISHLLIDTRVPLQIWRNIFGQTKDPANPVFVPMAMWQDQAAHLILIGLAALAVAR